MRVTATKDCFVGGSRRRMGSTFDYDGPLRSFLVLAADEGEASASPASVPSTLTIAGKKATINKTLKDHDTARVDGHRASDEEKI